MTTLAHASNVQAGLAKARLGVFDVYSKVVSAAAPLTVIAGGATGALAIAAQRGVPIAYVAVAALLSVFAVPYVAMARRMPNAGAFYIYVTAGLGRVAGAAVAFVAVLAYTAMKVGLYGGLGYEASKRLGELGYDVKWYWCSLACWVVVGCLGVLKIEVSAKVLSLLLAAEILVSVALAAVHVTHPADGQLSFGTLAPSWLLAPAGGVMMTIAIAGFVGFENTTVFSEEVRDAHRTVPLATGMALATIAGLYTFCIWAMIEAAGPANAVQLAGEQVSNLTFALAEPYAPAWIITVGRWLFVTSLFAAVLSFHNTSTRYLYAMGRDGLLPAVYGRVWARTNMPVAGSLTQSMIALCVILLYTLAGWDPYVQLFFWISASAGLGVLALMVATALAMLVYFARDRARTRQLDTIVDTIRAIPATPRHAVAGGLERISFWRGQLFPAFALVALAAIAVLTVRNFHLLLGVDPGSDLRVWFPASIAVSATIGALIAVILKVVNPSAYRRIGQGGATPAGAVR